jgi:DNA-damage-inducible protein J
MAGMQKENLNIWIDRAVKEKAETLFANYGISINEAINSFLQQSIREDAPYFDVYSPKYNAETEKAMQEAKQLSLSGQGYMNLQEALSAFDQNAKS